MLSNDEQPLKHWKGIVVTPDGILIVFSDLQNSKDLEPKVVNDSGNATDSRFLHVAYLQPIITQYFIDNKSEIWLLFLIAHSKR